ncbi:MAG: hypothetical protein L6Q76_24500 [Polyangiaceae bacterium]|nr:hypothetical protein [Polyangiaceae bacterium]
MKSRASAAALTLSLLVPSLLTEAGISSPLSAPHAFAQDAVTEVARQRYEEGVKAFDTGRYEDARAAFLQAYALKRHPAVLLNLGQSELRSGHYEDAGNHLQQFLRLHTSASAEQKKTAEKGIADAKKKTGFVIVIADANGAAVSIDGISVGTTPLLDPVFIKPGKHTVVATYQNKSATTQIDAKAGSAAAATLTLGTAGSPVASAPPPPPPSEPAPGAVPSGSPPPASTLGPPPSAPPSSTTDTSPLLPTVSTEMGSTGTMQPDQGPPVEREPIFSWYKRKPIAWVGTGLAGVGLVGGIVFSALTASVGSTADRHAGEIRDFVRNNNLGNIKPCAPEGSGQPDYSFTNAAGDQVSFGTACTVLREDLSDYDTNFAIATASWVVFGVGVLGTGAYALFDWYLAPPKKTASGPRVTAIAPVVSPTHQGIGVMGSF